DVNSSMMYSVLQLTPHARDAQVPAAQTHIRWYKIRNALGHPAAPPRTGVIRLPPMPGASGSPGGASNDTPITGSYDAALVRAVLRERVGVSLAEYIPPAPSWSPLVPQPAHPRCAQ